jgi:hypothetical protein
MLLSSGFWNSDGVTSIGSIIANLVMEDVEQRALAYVPVSLSFWKRFVDDVISAVSRNEIDILLKHLNSIEMLGFVIQVSTVYIHFKI